MSCRLIAISATGGHGRMAIRCLQRSPFLPMHYIMPMSGRQQGGMGRMLGRSKEGRTRLASRDRMNGGERYALTASVAACRILVTCFTTFLGVGERYIWPRDVR